MARGAKARGRRIAFGDGDRILWDKNSEQIFRDNPNIAKPGSERDRDIEWVGYFKGSRIYNRQDPIKQRWIWNPDFRPIAGELFFNDAERRNRVRYGKGFVLIEPNVESWKAVAPNKDWGWDNYQAVADWLRGEGYRVGQFRYEKSPVALDGVEQFRTRDFRDALGVLSQAALYIGPEGGLHHGAAATSVDAVVLFGGFIPPSVTGYEGHANLTGGAEACGNYTRCQHCIDAMAAITVDDVLDAVTERL